MKSYIGPPPDNEEMLQSLMRIQQFAIAEGGKYNFDPAVFCRSLTFIGLSILLSHAVDGRRHVVMKLFIKTMQDDLDNLKEEGDSLARAMDKEIATQLENLAREAAKAEEKELDEILKDVPEDLRKQVDAMMERALNSKPN